MYVLPHSRHGCSSSFRDEFDFDLFLDVLVTDILQFVGAPLMTDSHAGFMLFIAIEIYTLFALLVLSATKCDAEKTKMKQ